MNAAHSLNITYASPCVITGRAMGSCTSDSTGSSVCKLFSVLSGPSVIAAPGELENLLVLVPSHLKT